MANSSSKKKKKKVVYSGIGGQAVIEGIMMRNKDVYSVAVRLPDNSIDVKSWEDEGFCSKHKSLSKIPLIRGVFNFVDSLVLGMKTLTYSASFYEEEETKNGSDRFMEKVFKDKADSVVNGITIAISVIIAIGLFLVLPYFVSEWLGNFLRNDSLVTIIEGCLRLLIFILYILGISLMKDIRRLYQYHGAEHKCINCIESGRPLTVRNVMRSSRLHRRCGTSFLIMVMIISIILFFFIKVDSVALRLVLRLALIPVIASLSYELLRFAGKHDNFLVRIISAPGMLLQRITTKEPNEEIVEVAIASIEKIFDWEDFESKHFKRNVVKKTVVDENGQEYNTGEETLEISVVEVEEAIEKISQDNKESAKH